MKSIVLFLLGVIGLTNCLGPSYEIDINMKLYNDDEIVVRTKGTILGENGIIGITLKNVSNVDRYEYFVSVGGNEVPLISQVRLVYNVTIFSTHEPIFSENEIIDAQYDLTTDLDRAYIPHIRVRTASPDENAARYLVHDDPNNPHVIIVENISEEDYVLGMCLIRDGKLIGIAIYRDPETSKTVFAKISRRMINRKMKSFPFAHVDVGQPYPYIMMPEIF